MSKIGILTLTRIEIDFKRNTQINLFKVVLKSLKTDNNTDIGKLLQGIYNWLHGGARSRFDSGQCAQMELAAPDRAVLGLSAIQS